MLNNNQGGGIDLSGARSFAQFGGAQGGVQQNANSGFQMGGEISHTVDRDSPIISSHIVHVRWHKPAVHLAQGTKASLIGALMPQTSPSS